jgi:hypothetical protein
LDLDSESDSESDSIGTLSRTVYKRIELQAKTMNIKSRC